MQFVPARRLEGVISSDSTGSTRTHTHEKYIASCPRLDEEVKTLHELARAGHIPADTAERQINTYLLAASVKTKATSNTLSPKQLMLPLTDAPQPSLMPDLGHIIHQVLAQNPVQCVLSKVVEQCIPRFRHASRPIQYTDSQPILITLIMGLLMGLYQGPVKKPGFMARAATYQRIHWCLTSTPEEQTAFCHKNESIVLLSCMEYMARIPLLHMPVQNAALIEGDTATQAFYRRIPALCDELRQWLDEHQTLPKWSEIHSECTMKLERISRLKRTSSKHIAQNDTLRHFQSQHHKETYLHPTHHIKKYTPPADSDSLVPVSPQHVLRGWNAPYLPNSNRDEYRLLGLALQAPWEVIHHIQHEVCIQILPENIRRIQEEALAAVDSTRSRATFLQTRWYVCMQCMASGKSHSQRPRLRLDTLTQNLVCATCLSQNPLSINMIGRVLRYHNTHYYWCPSCTTIQPYQAQREQPWARPKHIEPAEGGWCTHRNPTDKKPRKGSGGKGFKQKGICCICSEHALTQSVTRVDHLTGEMQGFHYCQRHAPRFDAVRKYVNANQMLAFTGRGKKPNCY